jgi:hypothetical protein
MLVLCYGITKSGSTLTFELIKGMLESVGQVQVRLPDGPVNPGHRVNYVQPIDRRRLNQILAAVGERWIAVKTHAGFNDPLFPYLEELHDAKRLRIVASYRDPRDICLSLMDAGARSRAAGKKEFSEVTDLTSAVPRVLEQIAKFNKWAAVKGTLRLDYDLVAFSPDDALDRIEACLGILSDRARAKSHAFEEAFTQMNKGVPNRARDELSPQDYAQATQSFASFLENICGSDSERWLSALRADVLSRTDAGRRGSLG